MAATQASPLPGPSSGPPTPGESYRIAVEEYRFQAQFNWSRTQYLLGLNVLVLAAGTGIAAPAGAAAAALVFGFGAIAGCLSAAAVRTQHGYYRAAREHLKRVEETLAIPVELRLDTTRPLSGEGRHVSVNQVVYLLLGAMVLANAIGGALVLGVGN